MISADPLDSLYRPFPLGVHGPMVKNICLSGRKNKNVIVFNFFLDLHVYCGKESFVAISLHRAVLASCSPFLTRLLADRDETFLLLPDIDKDDFMALVHLVYCESGLENQVKLSQLIFRLFLTKT